ncbi:MAG: hypothetical protein RLY78_2537 [Pseudomonadota bacterium]|jgi:FMN reductase
MSTFSITLVAASTSAVSRTRALAGALGDAVQTALQQQTAALSGQPAEVQLRWVHGATLAAEPWAGSEPGPAWRDAIQAIARADLVIVASPVYKGSYTGLFKQLFDLVPPDALLERPVLLAANGGSDRHALVVDEQLRPLFAFFRAWTLPSAVYAAEADYAADLTLRSEGLRQRVAEAARQGAEFLLARELLRRAQPQTNGVARAAAAPPRPIALAA